MFKIAIVDDDEWYIEELERQIVQYAHEQSVSIEVFRFSSGLEMIYDYEPIYDIVFLDIEMPHMNGMELAHSIRKSDPHAVIIFVSNKPQYAIKGYEVNALDYIVKPVEYNLLSIKLEMAIKAKHSEQEYSIRIPFEDGSRHIKTGEIIFIEVRDHWLYVHTKDGEYQMLGTLKDMEDELKAHNIIRCNKSYLINLQHVTRMRSDIVILQGGEQLKMSRARRKEVQFAFVDYYGRKYF